MVKPGGRSGPEDGYQPVAKDVVDLSVFDAAVAKEVAIIEDLTFKLRVARSRVQLASDEVRKDEAFALIEDCKVALRQALAREVKARAARARARGPSAL